jgi:hypothetical protein
MSGMMFLAFIAQSGMTREVPARTIIAHGERLRKEQRHGKTDFNQLQVSTSIVALPRQYSHTSLV